MKKLLHRVNKYLWKIRWPIHIYQRIRYGISFTDSWGLYSYVLFILKFGIMRMYKNTCSYPPRLTYERWHNMLGDMLFFVSTAYDNSEGDMKTLWIPTSATMREDYKARNLNVMSKKDCNRYFKGRRYLLRYFYDLWD